MKKILFIIIIAGLIILGAILFVLAQPNQNPNNTSENNSVTGSATAPAAPSTSVAVISPGQFVRFFSDNFATTTVIEEGDKDAIKDPDWWVNSGAYFFAGDGIGRTLFGELATSSPWRLDYLNYNAPETDQGFHPQNIFRLVTRSEWQTYQQQVYYRMERYILSDSSNRRESNGFFLFNRYQDGDNLYYTGLRVDGNVSIKKKYKGVYYDMAEIPVIKSTLPYNRDTNPNLIPLDQWIGLRSDIHDNPDGSVQVSVYLDLHDTGVWTLAASVRDDGKTYGGPVISNPGYAGIRTDFMDVEFKNYSIGEYTPVSGK